MISKANFVVVSANEVTTVDVQQLINIQWYVMWNWKHVPILLTLKKVEVGATLDNIKGVILDAMGRYGSLTNSNMASKWIYLGCDGDSIFQGIWSRVIIQTKEHIASFIIDVCTMWHIEPI
jgi:hypothetical protein